MSNNIQKSPSQNTVTLDNQEILRFLSESEKIDKAKQIGDALGESSIEEYRVKL